TAVGRISTDPKVNSVSGLSGPLMAPSGRFERARAPRLCGVKADIPWNRTGGLVANRDGDNRPIAAKLPTQPEPFPYPNGARAYVAKRPVADLCMVFTRGSKPQRSGLSVRLDLAHRLLPRCFLL